MLPEDHRICANAALRILVSSAEAPSRSEAFACWIKSFARSEQNKSTKKAKHSYLNRTGARGKRPKPKAARATVTHARRAPALRPARMRGFFVAHVWISQLKFNIYNINGSRSQDTAHTHRLINNNTALRGGRRWGAAYLGAGVIFLISGLFAFGFTFYGFMSSATHG